MSPDPLIRIFVERSGTPNTVISIRSPGPSFTLEFAIRRGDVAVLEDDADVDVDVLEVEAVDAEGVAGEGMAPLAAAGCEACPVTGV